jgi:thiamine biosynthesis lipoprotein
MAADAWATALIVTGRLKGAALARRHTLDALFLDREGGHLRASPVGRLFDTGQRIREQTT